MKKIVQLSIFFVLYLSAFQIDAQSFTQFRGLGADNSAGTGFKTISTNSVLVVSNNATGTTNSVVGSELFSKLTTAGGTDVITLKADGVNSISFDVNDLSIFNFLDPASAADYTTNTKIVFKNSVGTIIRTMTLNATKSLTSSTSGVSIGAFFDNNASLPVTGVSEIEITINPSTVSVDAFTIRNITLSNIVSGAVPSGPASVDFNSLGISSTFSNTLGKSTAIGPLNFEINSAATNDLITFKANEGAGGTGALYDNNQDIGGITKWTISRHDGSEFTLSSIYLKEAGVGASTSGTLKARRNGAQVGSTVNVNFNGDINVSGNPDFTNIDEVWIEAADINFYLDNVSYVIPSTVVTPTLTTTAATSITASGATLNGNVTADGGASVSARGFVYSISDNTPTIGESGVTNVSDGSGTGTFSEAITGLTASTTYYYQAYATNSAGSSYGGIESFTTSGLDCTTPPDQDFGTHEDISYGGSVDYQCITYTGSDAYVGIGDAVGQGISTSPLFSGSAVVMGGNTSGGYVSFKSISTGNFKLVSLVGEFFGHSNGNSSEIYNIKGYDNGSEVISAEGFQVTASGSYGSGTAILNWVRADHNQDGSNSGTLSFGSGWSNVDEVRFYPAESAPYNNLYIGLDNIVFEPAVELQGTTLEKGDIGVIRINSDGVDGFSVVTLVPLEIGTSIFFTEQGWRGATLKWQENTECHMELVTTTSYPAGTVFHFDEESGNIISVRVNSESSVSYSFTSCANFSYIGGDQVIVYQGSLSSPQFITGLTNDDGGALFSNGYGNDATTRWAEEASGADAFVTGTQTSRIPTGLTNGVNCISLFYSVTTDPEIDNSKYNGIFTGTKSQLRAAINDKSNWVHDDFSMYARETKTFTIQAESSNIAPTVATWVTSAVTTTGATLKGEVTDDGGATVSERGFMYGTNINPTIGDGRSTQVQAGTGQGEFEQTITGLNSETTYYVRAYAINSEGTSYGSEESFTTNAPANIAPTIGGTTAGQNVNDNATISPFSAITVADADGDNVTATITLDDNAKGVITGADAGSGPYTMTSKTPAAMQTALRALVFNPTDNRTATSETTTFTIVMNDGTVDATNNTTTVISSAVGPAITAVSIPNATMKVGSVVTATITVTSDADNYTTGSGGLSGTIGGFTLGSLSKINNTTYTATFTVTEGGTDVVAGSDIPISITMTDSGGKAGNTFTSAISQNADAIDANTPAVPSAADLQAGTDTGSSSTDNLTSDTTPNFTGRKGAIGDIVKLTSSVDGLLGTALDNGTTTWLFNASPVLSAGVHSITVTSTDAAGNVSASSAALSITIDTARPTATVAISDAALKVGETATVTITFSEAVTGFTNADLTIPNGTLTAVSSADGGITWTATFTPTVGVTDATNVITLDNTGVADAAGNAGSGTTDSGNYTIDTTRPTATIAISDAALKAGETATVTITFSEAVTGFTNADLTIPNGTLTAVSSADGGITWTATFTPTAGVTDATNVITLDNTGVSDAAGNAGTGTTNSGNYTIDTARPTATVAISDAALKVGETATVTITFSEAVTGFTNADLTIPNGTLTAVSSADGGITWTATFTPTAGVTDATNVITLDNTGVADAAGNAGAGTTDSGNYTIDTTRPTATIAISDAALKAGETATVTITFSEAVTGFTNADLTIPNGTLTAVSSADGGITWTATFTPTAGVTDATNVITLDNTGVSDAAGNAGTGTTNSGNYTIDTIVPTATITLNEVALKIGETATVTITFSEAVTGFTNADLTIPNGTLTAVSSADGGITWTATFTPTVGVTDATNVITLNNTGVTNAAGNAGTGTTDSGNFAVDTTRPTATITLNDVALKIGETATVTITFSEAVTGFTNADLTMPNGTLTAVSSADGGITWTATLTPSAGVTDATNVITLDNAGIADLAGNAGSGTTDSNNYEIDTQRPTATIVVSDTQLKVGETSLVTFTFSEAVTGFTNADLAVANGTLSGLSSSDGGVTWTATLTPSAGVTDATNVITLDNAGIADLAGNAGSGTTDSNNYEIDTQRPTATIVVSDTQLKVGETSLVIFTFSEAVTGFSSADLTVANGSLSGLSSSDGGITWTATLTPSAGVTDATNLITLDNTGVADQAGNTGSGTTNSNNYVIDNVAPTVTDPEISISGASGTGGAFKIGDTVTATWNNTADGDNNSDFISSVTINFSQFGGESAVAASNSSGIWSATYTITAGAIDASNRNISVTANDSAGNETTTADTSNATVDNIAPSVSVFSPLNSAIEVALQPTLTITFDQEVTLGNAGIFKLGKVGEDACTIESIIEFDLSDSAVKSLFVLSEDKLTLSLEITENLPLNTQVIMEIPAGFVSDAVGNSFAGFSSYSYTWSFTTITKNAQMITFPEIGAKTYGNPIFTLGNAETDRGLTVTYTAADPTVVNITGNQATILKAGSTTITATQEGDESNFAALEVERTLTVGKKALTITADNKSKTYGEANPTLTFSYAGLVNGDEKVSTEPTVVTTATASSNVGTYPITLTGGEDQNYAITLVNGTLTIGKKALTITADNKSKTYGEANPTLTFSYAGLVNGDEKVSTEPTVATTATASSNVGTYPITLTGGVDQNYAITLVNGTLTIGKKEVTITADNKSKTYGEANPTLTFSYEGLVNGDEKVSTEPTVATTATASSNVGTYPITLTGGEDQNYAITLVNGTLTIGKKALTITADNKSKTYGEANPTLTFSYDGLTNGDEKVDTEPSIATTATASSNVGTYPITLTGGEDQNYAITLVNGTLTIGKKEVTITADNKSKTYGEANPTLTFSYNGLTNGDEKVSTEPSIATTATASSNVGTYPIALEGAADANYAITLVNGTLTIGKKEVTITADNKSKTYGEANPTLTFSYEGLVNGDEKVSTEPTVATTATASSNVGTYPITLTGGEDQNYAITLVNGTLTIGKKALTITADNKSKTYGEANPTLTFSYNGLTNGDEKVVTEPSIATTATASSNVGTYPITLTGGEDQNYAITLVNGTLTIGKKEVTITADDKSKTYGEANPTLTFSYDGLTNGDEKVDTEPSIATTATASSNVGTYPITLTGGEDQNYAITLVNGTLTIGKKALTITADNKSKTYGEANPTLTFSYAGLVNGDTKVTNEPSIATTATASSNVGTYPITLTGGEDQNYAITLVNGTLTIGKKALTITADNKSKTYGEANPTLTFSYNGLTNGDEKVVTEPSIATTATASSNVGTYPITLTGGEDQNYAISLVNGTLTIGKKEVTITADSKSKTYGEANPTLTFSYNGLTNGDEKVATEPSIATTATASSNVGTYPITLTGGEDQNYAITLVNGTLTIGKKEVTITADDKSKTYGEANPTLTFSYDGLTNGDEKVDTEPSIATTATASSNVGTYPITLTGGEDQNYAITLVNGTLTIGKKALTITADDKSKTYGEANPTLTFSYDGLTNGDEKVDTEPSIATTATASSNVGTYSITLTSGSDQNYAITLVNGTLTIGKKEVTITADNKSKTYGEVNPTLTFSYVGLVNGDVKVTNEPSIATTATASSNVGTYPITLTGGEDQNYAITLVNGTLTIGKKEVTITADDKSKTYGEANPTLTFSYDGLTNGDEKVDTEPSIATTATASSNVGTYSITLTSGSDQNYAITLVNGTLTIGKKEVTITADNKQKVYGEAKPTLTFSYNGLTNGDEKVSTEPSIATTATTSSNVGTYPITLTGGEDQNYAITLVNGTLTVTKATLKIQANAHSKIFGSSDPELTFIAIGFKGTENISSLTGKLSREEGELVGSYKIVLGTLIPSNNYEVEYISAQFEIIPAELITISDHELITTPWSVSPSLPINLSAVTADGQVVQLPVTWDQTPLNIFKRGAYFLTGIVTLPSGILNPAELMATVEVNVLAKPAPQDVILSNNDFDPDPANYFQEIGNFTVVDPIDNVHSIMLVPGAGDNEHFEVKSGILFWSSADEVSGKTEFTVVIQVADRDGNVIEKQFTINRGRTDIMALEIFNSFTPNGDGVNDTWGVPDLRYYTGVRVQVFDRNSERMFYTEDADVRWDGTYKGKEMPVGTYFWVVEVIETGIIRRGILTILKD